MATRSHPREPGRRCVKRRLGIGLVWLKMATWPCVPETSPWAMAFDPCYSTLRWSRTRGEEGHQLQYTSPRQSRSNGQVDWWDYKLDTVNQDNSMFSVDTRDTQEQSIVQRPAGGWASPASRGFFGEIYSKTMLPRRNQGDKSRAIDLCFEPIDSTTTCIKWREISGIRTD